MSRIAIVEGIRTPFIRAWTDFSDIAAQELGRIVVRELLEKTALDADRIDEVIFGCVAQPVEASNVARVISLLAGIPKDKRAYTVSRNCASGFESITSAAEKIALGLDEIVIAGGTESMSNIPFLYSKEAANIFLKISKAKSFFERLAVFLEFRPRHFLNPRIGLQLGLTDAVCGLNMGQTAEVLAKEYGISRQEQDEFALTSHQRVFAAKERLKEEIAPVFIPPKYEKVVLKDNGARENIPLRDLAGLKPLFDRYCGTVGAGNSCQITDGAAAVLLMKEDQARALGYSPLGFIRAYTYVGVEPRRMGLGPALAIPEVLKKAGLKLSDIGLIEINEAFAVQVLACARELENNGTGTLNRAMLNVNGGAIALGHPVGTTGTRLALTLLKEMQRRDLRLGLASLCVGGGQGAALVLER